MKKIFRLVFLALMSLAIFFTINEMVFRLLDKIKSRESFHCPSPVASLPYENRKEVTVIANGIEYRLNSLGMRDREYSIVKEKSIYRIIMLGDSAVFGSYVPLEDTMTERLEKLLNGKIESSPRPAGSAGEECAEKTRSVHPRGHGCKAVERGSLRYEVFNTGVASYNLRNYIDALKYKWMDMAPDMVIIGLSPFNDHLDKEARSNYSVVGRNFMLGFLYRHSKFFIALIGKARRWALEREIEPSTRDINELKKYLDDQDSVRGILRFLKEKGYNLKYFLPNIRRIMDRDKWKECERYLEEFALICKKRGIIPVLVIFPMEFQLINEYVEKEPNQTISDMAERYDILTINLVQDFKNYLGDNKTSKLFEQPQDMFHFNGKGHYLSAARIFKSISSSHINR